MSHLGHKRWYRRLVRVWENLQAQDNPATVNEPNNGGDSPPSSSSIRYGNGCHRRIFRTWDNCRMRQRPRGYDNVWEDYPPFFSNQPLPLAKFAKLWGALTFIILMAIPFLLSAIVNSSSSSADDDSKSFSIWLVWIMLWNICFAYVSHVMSRRNNPFKGRHQGYHDIMAINIIMIIIGSYLDITTFFYLSLRSHSGASRILPLCIAFVAMFIILHTSILTNSIMPSISQFSLTPSRMHHLPMWLMIPVVIIATGIFGMIGISLVATDNLFNYGIGYLLVILLVFTMSLCLSDEFKLWIHHWALSLFLIPLMYPMIQFSFSPQYTKVMSHPLIDDWFPLCSLVFTFGLIAGFIEGGARWSLAPIWHQRAHS